ncbi:TIGR04540 family protein [Oceanirhabdus seepicola]|uniref:TIGR04540 family protein n=1 Tax=Oceanirhabdus seepicola TaxID=2828781 RepID=A0A9J6P4Z2_9CLOT|nr:TIGR04540 family protein [Oceanirhabdus seepicola]
MEVKKFYRTQRELAYAINKLIDAYWNDEISDELIIQKITDLYTNNPSKVLKNDDFTTILKQQCGKRRLEVVGKILA